MNIELYEHQKTALEKMHNGCILCGGVGSGKSRTALAYFIQTFAKEIYPDNKTGNIPDLYIITTAKKRDNLEWEEELIPFYLNVHKEKNKYNNNVVIDSWNNIAKYRDAVGSFFIFDEQRLVGNGSWVESFLNIAKSNCWILLSATPGDVWADYIPVFLANGFYRNRTEFMNRHVVYSRFCKYPKIDRYLDTDKLVRLRRRLLVPMEFERNTVRHNIDIWVDYNKGMYKTILSTRTNPWKIDPYFDGPAPIQHAGELCSVLRRVVNEDESRGVSILEIFETKNRMIVFYNFDYELDILKNLRYGEDVEVAEWNGHKHQEMPTSKRWVYLVQYTAGAEGWNCITTDTIVFYSQTYSFRVLEQAMGRIDRLNTPYRDLYYYHLKSHSGIDVSISRALKAKRVFNVGAFVKRI